MSIADEIVAAPAGARFFRADLHLHSFGASHDVSDTGMCPASIAATAAAESIALLAITDHNEIKNVRETIRASQGADVFVVPGIELSTPDGHLLVYHDTIEGLEDYYGKLSFADRGTAKSRCHTSLLECLNKINIKSGFALLAHIDEDSGLEKTLPAFSQHKLDILCHPALLGFEVRSAQSDLLYTDADTMPERADWAKQRIAKLKLGQKQFLARVLFSDSHTLAGLGKNAQGNKRITRIKMDAPSFNGLRVALQDADARIRLEDEVPSSVPYLMGMKFEGGFLDGHVLHFSRNLNCIIGGRGAGKSTAFEGARVVSPTHSNSKLIDSEVWPVTMHAVWVDQAGQQHLLRRSINEETQNLTDPLTGPIVFPVESYGQSETAQTSAQAQNDPAALLMYLDKFTDVDGLLGEEEDVRNQLLENQTAIEKASSYVARIPEVKKLLWHTQQQLKALESAKAGDVVQLERKIAEERGIREQIDEQLAELASAVSDTTVTDLIKDLSQIAKPAELKVGAAELQVILAELEAFRVAAEKEHNALAASSRKCNTATKKALLEWKAKEKGITDQIEEKRRALLAQGIRLDSAYIKKLATDENSHKTTLKTLADWETRLMRLQSARDDLLKQRQALRTKIYNARVAYSVLANRTLKNALSDFFVDVAFAESALSAEAEAIIQEAMGWRTIQVPRAALITEQVTVPRLLVAITKNDPTPILAVLAGDGTKPFGRNDALDVLRTLSQPAVLYRLQRCYYDDRPKITVTKKVIRGGKPSYISREFARLSLGQQQSVLLALMLSSDSKYPLLIDQPEDNLDSEFIFHSLVPVLRSAKERRQVIIVTHNANIAVLGDAEEIVALKSTSDKAAIVATGSIDDATTRGVVCQILEGAEEAFRRRAKMYGIHG